MDLNKHIVSGDSAPVSVPVFNCVVYISQRDGTVVARVANIDGIEVTGSDERDALTRVVAAFKEHVRNHTENKNEIAWVEPIPDPEAGERRRFVPVHL